MTISINYKKRKNHRLFEKFETNQKIGLLNAQNYIPIYNRFFSLNETNFNSVNLNHHWLLNDIKEKSKEKDGCENVLSCDLKSLDDEFEMSQKTFVKLAPLLDPFKYLVGKYNHLDTHLFDLPSLNNLESIHPKIADPNNSSYIDGFFSYLSSQMLHKSKFIHGIDCYGIFLGIKKNFKLNVIDDLDYLVQSDFFKKQKDNLFTIEDYSHLVVEPAKQTLKPLNISLSSIIEDADDVDVDVDVMEVEEEIISLEDIKNMNMEIVDVTDTFQFQNDKKSTSLKSGSSCSSRTSHTNDDDDIDDESSDEDDREDSETKWEDVDDDDEDENSSFSDFEEETLYATLPKFPVQMISMEQCENTLDYLILNEKLENDEQWFSALMQIIMSLIVYQKVFSFTHNDLHTNNVMYVPTSQKYLYYVYKKKYYKVPTFGKIYKIIDFGRAIYKFDEKLFCSDSFQPGCDAATQYNTEPYFNEQKPRLEPNFSFDLCRLACSIFDYIVEDMSEIENLSETEPLVRLIKEWCTDDNGRNVLYKNNGVERYPNFKLYKMIARCVHNHTPVAQLERSEFSQFCINKNGVPKGEHIMNIDDMSHL
jgi:hypothetical protein